MKLIALFAVVGLAAAAALVVPAEEASGRAICVAYVLEPVSWDRCDGVVCIGGYHGIYGWQDCYLQRPYDCFDYGCVPP